MNGKHCKLLIIIPLLFTLTCANKESDPLAKVSSADSSWVYQLQNPKIKNLAKSGFPLAVIDYSKDGSDDKRFSQNKLQRLIKKNMTVLVQ